MIMKTPTPFGVSSLNNSPLVADGSDFPCKQRPGVYDVGSAKNTMPIGVNQTLSFTGSAVHGGGSCQISITTDKAPTKDTKWNVIHSIEGGCPANTAGNLPENPDGSSASTFQFSIPEGVAAGDYVLAWTWFNKIGNREMYMNCAPITVTAGSKKRSYPPPVKATKPGFTKRSSFPGMFVANVGNGCATVDSADLKFPQPGDSIQFAGSSALTPPSPANCGTQAALGGASSGSSASSGSAGSSGSAPAPAASSAAPAAPASSAGGAAASVAPIVPAPAASSAASAAPSAAAPVASSVAAGTYTPVASAPSAGSTGSSTGGGATSGGPCSGSAMTCSPDGKQFGSCVNGNTVWQPVAAGTSCTNGQIGFAADYAKSVGMGKRHPGHVRRSHSGAFFS